MRPLKKRLEIAASKFGDSGHPACEGIKSRTTESLPKQGNYIVLASTLHFTKHTLQRKITTVMLAITFIFTCSNCDKLRKIDFDELRKIECNKGIGNIVPTRSLKESFVMGNQASMLQENIVITTDTAWNTWLSSLSAITYKWLGTFLSQLQIDFSTHQVLVVVDEVRSGNGEVWAIEIAEIKEYACHIAVTYHTWKQCGSTNKNFSTQSYHFVQIPATNKPIVFEQEYDTLTENVPYMACSQVYGDDTIYLQGYAYLFRDSIPSTHVTNNRVMNIVYYTIQDLTIFSINVNGWYYNFSDLYYPYLSGSVICNGEICNFPIFAKANIPPQGKKVYYKGKFLWRETLGFTIYGNLTLTYLEERN